MFGRPAFLWSGDARGGFKFLTLKHKFLLCTFQCCFPFNSDCKTFSPASAQLSWDCEEGPLGFQNGKIANMKSVQGNSLSYRMQLCIT
jgi:hypothetical protein